MKIKTVTAELSDAKYTDNFKKQVSDYVTKNTLSYVEVKTESVRRRVDPHTKRLLSYLFAGSRGGINRLRILLLLAERPLNANQLAKELGLDYKAILHHIGVLEKNNMITRSGEKYGVIFMISNFLEFNIDTFNEIVAKLKF